MTTEDTLKKTRNLVRYIFRKMDKEFDIRFRENNKFFFDLMEQCEEVGLIKEDNGRYILTEKEQLEGQRKGPRHFGKRSRKKLTLL